MTTRSPALWRTFVVFLIPMMLTNILQAMAGTVDGIYIGQMLGVEAIAAVSAFFPVFFFMLAIVIGVASGATVLIGQAWGANEPETVRAVAGTALALVLLGALIVAAVGAPSAEAVMRGLGTPANILDDATLYARIMLAAMPLILLLLLATSIIRGVGDSVSPLWTLGLATGVQLLVTPALIRGWFGLPQLGVASAAVSTIVAFSLALTVLAVVLRRRGHPLAPDAALFAHFRIDRHWLCRILGIGVPAAVQMVIMALAEIALLGLVNRHGSDATAAYGAITQIMSYVQFPVMSVGIATAILASHMIGAGNVGALGRLMRTGQMMNLVFTGGFVAAVYALAPTIIGLFITDPAVVVLALDLLQIVVWSCVILGMAAVLSGVMRASGDMLMPTLLSVSAIIVIEVPMAMILDRAIGIEGIWIGYPSAFVAMALSQMAYYALIWRKKPVSRLI